MTIGKEDGVISSDTFAIEVFREKGIEQVAFVRYDKDKRLPSVLFARGDELAGQDIVSQVAGLVGVEVHFKKGKK